MTGPVTIVIDQIDSLTNPESLAFLEEVATRLPDDVRLVLASRVEPRLPMARLRVEGRLLELGAQDLALDLDEATGLLVAAGIDIDGLDVQDLVDRTEGWPAGLFLAALAMQVAPSRDDAAVALRGDSRYLGDYLRAEVLDRVSPEVSAFLVRTSILDRLSGPLCDATLDAGGSSDRLDAMERRKLLIVPLDDRHEWYRYHRLFGELLRTELHRREPGARCPSSMAGRQGGMRRTDGRRRHFGMPRRQRTSTSSLSCSTACCSPCGPADAPARSWDGWSGWPRRTCSIATPPSRSTAP